ncbi:YraN family protein [Flammeovirga pectinis]|uniref:UPF0102 protein EI427_09145 n=1 Tax=Flammeovirga pectinis TaxID=2494373 RepID=A0A3Q9FNM1_9BACT|nr:YraN family protein [Flammeovirga pectinis]AZQ62395.1 YraN family protein [Flammeovirga pectinis]
MRSINTTAQKRFGTNGENIASKYLIDKGYTLLKRNYKYSYNEIDIICKKDRFLVFVEVKTRSSNDFGFPENHVSKKQINNITNAAIHYMETNNNSNYLVRYDIISITYTSNTIDIKHIEDAFY